MLKETLTIILSLVEFQLGLGPLTPFGYAYVVSLCFRVLACISRPVYNSVLCIGLIYQNAANSKANSGLCQSTDTTFRKKNKPAPPPYP